MPGLDGLGPGVSNLIALDDLNLRARDQNLCESESSITNDHVEVGSRSVVIPINPLPAQSGEVSFRGEIDGQNLCGRRSPRSNPIYGRDGLVQGGPPTVPKPIEESFTILVAIN